MASSCDYCLSISRTVNGNTFGAFFDTVGLELGFWEEHPACKKFDWWGAGVVIFYQSANGLYIVQLMPLLPIISCFIKIQNSSAFLDNQVVLEKAIKWV